MFNFIRSKWSWKNYLYEAIGNDIVFSTLWV